MTVNTVPLANRFEGRLFAEEGRLYFVVEVDAAKGVARVSCQVDGERQVIEMPVSEIGARLFPRVSELHLEESNSGAAARITEQDDGWYYRTRDGLKGPYLSEEAASTALNEFIESVKKEQ